MIIDPLPDETIHAHTRQHPIVLTGPIALAAIMIGIGVAIPIVAPDQLPVPDWTPLALAGLCLLVALLTLTVTITSWSRRHYLITSHRVIKTFGIIRNTESLPIRKIGDITMRRGLAALIGAGTLTLTDAANADHAFTLQTIPHVKQHRRQLNTAIYQ